MSKKVNASEEAKIATESSYHLKNGASLKSQVSRKILMKRILAICLFLVYFSFCWGQSKRTLPPDINVYPVIVESVSYLSYIGEPDTTEKWFDIESVGKGFYITEKTVGLWIEDEDITSSIHKFWFLASPTNYGLAGTSSSGFENKLNDYWHSNDNKENVDLEDKGSFGFSISGKNNIKFYIDIYPNKKKCSDGNYDNGTTIITIEQNGKKVWVLYCCNISI